MTNVNTVEGPELYVIDLGNGHFDVAMKPRLVPISIDKLKLGASSSHVFSPTTKQYVLAKQTGLTPQDKGKGE